jgi:hypothetical protein
MKNVEVTMTREQWLNKALDEMRPWFVDAGDPLPEKIRISVGWMGGRGRKSSTIGQCWHPDQVEDKTPAIFIVPTLNDPIRILDVLVHEGVHAAGKFNHRKEFSDLAKKLGLEKPWTATHAGEELKKRLTELAEKLGPFDHAAIRKDAIKRQTTRLLKVMCHSCGYVARITAKWIDYGFPTCPCGEEMDYG